MSKVNGKSRDKKKKKPCGDGFRLDPDYVQKDSTKPKFKCIKIKKKPPSGVRKKEDGRGKPKGPSDVRKDRKVLPHEKQHSQFKKPPSGIKKNEE